MGQPEAHPKAMEVEADAVEPVEGYVCLTDAMGEPIAVPPEADADGWISTKSLLESLTAQGIKLSMRTLQNWGDKHEATKPGFEPPYTAKKDVKGNWVWKPA